MASIDTGFTRFHHPMDMIEQIASGYDWSFERNADDELSLSVEGKWTNYHLSLNWREDLEALHLACAVDLKVPATRMDEVYRLVAAINEQLWVGHFDIWRNDGLLLFRHGLLLNGAEPTSMQCEALIHASLEAGERYYQAFQYVIWAGKSAEDALAAVMFETEGEA